MLVAGSIRLVLSNTAVEDEGLNMVILLSIVGRNDIEGIDDVLGLPVTLSLIDMIDIGGAKDELGMVLMLLFVCKTIDGVGVVRMAESVSVET